MAAKAVKAIITTPSGYVLGWKNGIFSLLGGRLLAGESLERGIRREVHEETNGLHLRRVAFWKTFYGRPRGRKGKKKMSDAIFVARGSGPIQIRGRELDGIGIFKKWRELPLTATSRHALELYEEQNGYPKG